MDTTAEVLQVIRDEHGLIRTQQKEELQELVAVLERGRKSTERRLLSELEALQNSVAAIATSRTRGIDNQPSIEFVKSPLDDVVPDAIVAADVAPHGHAPAGDEPPQVRTAFSSTSSDGAGETRVSVRQAAQKRARDTNEDGADAAVLPSPPAAENPVAPQPPVPVSSAEQDAPSHSPSKVSSPAQSEGGGQEVSSAVALTTWVSGMPGEPERPQDDALLSTTGGKKVHPEVDEEPRARSTTREFEGRLSKQSRVTGTSSRTGERKGMAMTERSSLGSEDTLDAHEQDRLEWNEHMRNAVGHRLKKGKSGLLTYNDTSRQFLCKSKALLNFAQSSIFSTLCSAAVLLNAAFIGVTTDVGMARAMSGGTEPEVFNKIHLGFAIVFSIELCIRLAAFQVQFFIGHDWRWNLFDSVIVLTSIIEEMLQNVGPVGFLRVLKGLRMVRVLRIVRVFRIMRDLRLMVCSVFQSFLSFFWALMLLFVMMYLSSVFFMQGALSHLNDVGSDSAFKRDISTLYSSLPEAFLTMIMCITGGIDWHEAITPLASIHWMYVLVFVLYILFLVIGVLNVLTGIFVERAQELSGLDKDLVIQGEIKRNETFLYEMKKLFEEADTDRSGSVSWNEFKVYLQNEDVKAYLATQQLDPYDARQLFNILALGDDEEVGIEEFVMGCMRLKGVAKSVDVVALLMEGREFRREFKRIMKKIEDQVAYLCVHEGGRQINMRQHVDEPTSSSIAFAGVPGLSRD